MKEAKAPASSSYQDYLIKSLKNPERAAGYISVMLELDQEGYLISCTSLDSCNYQNM